MSSTLTSAYTLPSSISEVSPHIFISDWYTSNKFDILKQYNIKGIITVEKLQKPQQFTNFIKENNIDFIQIFLDDTPTENIDNYFDNTFSFIDDLVKKDQNVLVHCRAGISRSATIVLNYLIRKLYETTFQKNEKITEPKTAVDISLIYVRNFRPQINPNYGFLKQLQNKAEDYINNSKKYFNYNQNIFKEDEKNIIKTDLNSLDNNKINTMNSMQQKPTDCDVFIDAEGKVGPVICLNDNDFDQNGNLVNFKGMNGVILFFAPWCGHCRHMKPAYARFANMLRGSNTRAFAVNGDKAKELIKRINIKNFGYEVNGFPNIVGYFNGSYYSNYSPDPNNRQAYRSAEDLLEYSKGLGTAPIQWTQ